MLLESAPLEETVARLRAGELDLHQYVDEMCDRITALDAELWAFVSEPDRRGRLQGEADALLARYPQPAQRPELFGALVGVKDIFHVDGFVTQAGTAVPPEAFGGEEAASVRLLRAAGALVAGKTVTTEFAYFEPGPTRNPHNLEHTPGGSSSGSAAAVAAGMCPLALGTQTIGSVIRPAAFCGVVGFKPTLHRIPSEGIVYFSPTMDHVGLFTQDIGGMKLAAATLCRGWVEVELGEEDVPILGVPDGPYLRQVSAEGRALFEQQLERLGKAGYTIWYVPTLLDIEELSRTAPAPGVCRICPRTRRALSALMLSAIARAPSRLLRPGARSASKSWRICAAAACCCATGWRRRWHRPASTCGCARPHWGRRRRGCRPRAIPA